MPAGAIEANPAAGSAVMRGMKRRDLIYRPTHHPYTPWPEARQVAEQLSARLRDKGGSGRVLLFILLTATRAKEASGARWEEIDRKERTWTVPAERTKTRTEHRVPLSNQAMELLYGNGHGTSGTKFHASLGDSEFVFPASRNPHQAINSDSLRTVRKQILGEGTTHGLRSTFRTYCADQGLETRPRRSVPGSRRRQQHRAKLPTLRHHRAPARSNAAMGRLRPPPNLTSAVRRRGCRRPWLRTRPVRTRRSASP